MLLLFTSIQERFSSLIENHLTKDNLYKFYLGAESLKETSISILENDVCLEQMGRKVTLSQITGVWIKYQSVIVSSEEDQNYCGFADYCNYKLWKDEWNAIIKQLIAHLSYIGIPFFDEASAIIYAEKKLLQLDIARTIGFNVPASIISNSKSAIQDFLLQHNDEGILKLSTQPTFKKGEDIFFIYANKVSCSDFNEMGTTIDSPFIVQNYIKKLFEVRYTFINGEHFVCKIESQLSDRSSIDFRRYDFANTPYVSINPPAEIKSMVTEFMKQLNLNYGALDFIVDPSNNWYFLEVNPVGQYGWIEHLTGLKITSAILHFLFQKNMI